MYRNISKWGTLLIALAAVGVYGCSASTPATTGTADRSATDTPEPTTVASQEPMGHEAHAGHADHAGHGDHAAGQAEGGAGMEKMMEGLASLSEADRASAMKQHVCPVSGQMLGTMGVPVKVSVEGRELWLCCPGCEGQLRADPAQYLAKLAK